MIEAFAAWSLVRIIGAIPITPGGFGIVELGLTTALVAFGGANAGVVAAVLIYRFLTVVPTLVLGGLAALTWRSHRIQPRDRLSCGQETRPRRGTRLAWRSRATRTRCAPPSEATSSGSGARRESRRAVAPAPEPSDAAAPTPRPQPTTGASPRALSWLDRLRDRR